MLDVEHMEPTAPFRIRRSEPTPRITEKRPFFKTWEEGKGSVVCYSGGETGQQSWLHLIARQFGLRALFSTAGLKIPSVSQKTALAASLQAVLKLFHFVKDNWRFVLPFRVNFYFFLSSSSGPSPEHSSRKGEAWGLNPCSGDYLCTSNAP